MNRTDLLKRLIESIDYPVDRLIVGFQCPTNEIMEDIYQTVRKNINILSYHSIQFSYNVGVSYGWNRIIEMCDDFDYIIIPGDDIIFEKDTLKNTKEFINKNNDKFIIGTFNCRDFVHRQGTYSGYSCFVYTHKTREIVGLFDENYYPAYFEDNDHSRRLLATKNEFTILPYIVIHGDNNSHHSCTFYSINQEYREKMKKCYGLNSDYFKTKWGYYVHDFSGEKTIFLDMFNNDKELLKDYTEHKWRKQNLMVMNGNTDDPIINIQKYF